MPNDYKLPHSLRKQQTQKSAALPESDKKTLSSDYLLGHENHFDPNTYTPEQMGKKIGAPEPVKTI
jgi:hypothetical protein